MPWNELWSVITASATRESPGFPSEKQRDKPSCRGKVTFDKGTAVRTDGLHTLLWQQGYSGIMRQDNDDITASWCAFPQARYRRLIQIPRVQRNLHPRRRLMRRAATPADSWVAAASLVVGPSSLLPPSSVGGSEEVSGFFRLQGGDSWRNNTQVVGSYRGCRPYSLPLTSQLLPYSGAVKRDQRPH